ncbi:2-phosphosulfolactate phosphatase [Sciscionella marina]|uniref:2-phosphosulfolactate phosphatase n=1 Tax=Sciscionella marina TaxID=508770 RepID=UPI00036DC56A|nr:2-phosphosulfolactate phosphatase [Sciscionella marina]
MESYHRQLGHPVRCDWGPEGLDALADCAVLIIVDVLSFCTSATIVTERGSSVLPLRMTDDGEFDAARARGAVLAGDRSWTLRPSSLTGMEPGVLLGLPSPNGATLCVLAAGTGATVLVGSLRNASAVAAAATRHGGPIGVLAAGERWGSRSGPLRPAAEDQLGAGAIVTALESARSPEAELAAAGFAALRPRLAPALRDCVSGRELITKGHPGDVELAAEHDVTEVVPELRDGILAPQRVPGLA